MRGSTSFGNMFMAGDWIISRQGSWSQVLFFSLVHYFLAQKWRMTLIWFCALTKQEKSYVTGLEAANRVVDFLGEGSFAKIIPVEQDEPHIEALRSLNRRFYEIREQLPLSDFFLQ